MLQGEAMSGQHDNSAESTCRRTQCTPTRLMFLSKTRFIGIWNCNGASVSTARNGMGGLTSTHLLYAACSKAHDDSPPIPSDALQAWLNHADRIIDDIGALSACDLQDLLLPVGLCIVERKVGPAFLLAHAELFSRSCRCNDLGTQGY